MHAEKQVKNALQNATDAAMRIKENCEAAYAHRVSSVSTLKDIDEVIAALYAIADDAALPSAEEGKEAVKECECGCPMGRGVCMDGASVICKEKPPLIEPTRPSEAERAERAAKAATEIIDKRDTYCAGPNSKPCFGVHEAKAVILRTCYGEEGSAK